MAEKSPEKKAPEKPETKPRLGADPNTAHALGNLAVRNAQQGNRK
jgi:hypothetical protein